MKQLNYKRRCVIFCFDKNTEVTTLTFDWQKNSRRDNPKT